MEKDRTLAALEEHFVEERQVAIAYLLQLAMRACRTPTEDVVKEELISFYGCLKWLGVKPEEIDSVFRSYFAIYGMKKS